MCTDGGCFIHQPTVWIGEVCFKKRSCTRTNTSEVGNTKTGFYQLYDLLIKFD